MLIVHIWIIILRHHWIAEIGVVGRRLVIVNWHAWRHLNAHLRRRNIHIGRRDLRWYLNRSGHSCRIVFWACRWNFLCNWVLKTVK